MIYCDQDAVAARDKELQAALGTTAAQGNEAAQTQVRRRFCLHLSTLALICFCRWT
jgi:hypothetical protein